MNAPLQTQTQAPAKTSFAPTSNSHLLQRKCVCGGSPSPAGECKECSEQRLSLRRKAEDSNLENRNSTGVPSIVDEVLSSPGQPLDPETRTFMEPRFGHDFGRVRVHTDERAGESAKAVNAVAYTVGLDVVFAPGQYRPDSAQGRSLLAHELTHTIQQGSGNGRDISGASGVGDPSEHEAEQAARVINDGQAFQPIENGGPLLARQVDAGVPGGAPAPASEPETATPTAGKTYNFSITMDGCDKAPFAEATIKAAAREAFDKVKDTDCVKSSSLKDEILGRFDGLTIECEQGHDICSKWSDLCGCAGKAFSNTINLYKDALSSETCGPLASTILHEVIHLWSPLRSHDVNYGCEKSCFGAGSGDAANCK